jgi:hypothetical protein
MVRKQKYNTERLFLRNIRKKIITAAAVLQRVVNTDGKPVLAYAMLLDNN